GGGRRERRCCASVTQPSAYIDLAGRGYSVPPARGVGRPRRTRVTSHTTIGASLGSPVWKRPAIRKKQEGRDALPPSAREARDVLPTSLWEGCGVLPRQAPEGRS